MSKLAAMKGTFSIRAKLLLIQGAVVASIVALVFAGWSGISVLQKSQDVDRELEQAKLEIQRVTRGILELNLSKGAEASRKSLKNSLADLQRQMGDVYHSIENPTARKAFEDELTKHLNFLESYSAKLLELSPSDHEAGDVRVNILTVDAMNAADEVQVHLDQVHDEETAVTGQNSEEALVWLGVGTAVVLVAVFFLFMLLYQNLISPIHRLARFAHQVAGGDFSARIDIERGDEIGALATDLMHMAETLRTAMGRMKEASDRLSTNVGAASREAAASGERAGVTLAAYEDELSSVAAASDELVTVTDDVARQCEDLKILAGESADSIARIADSLDHIAKTSELHSRAANGSVEEVKAMLEALSEISAALQSLSASSTEVAAAISQMQVTVDGVSQRAKESSRAARKVTELASEKGLAAAESAERGIKTLFDSVGSLASTIERLENRSMNIGNIVNVIDDIAAQTSLLALNAAILAAQAGHKGEGFAVVANEVKALAERIVLSTKEIEKVVKEANADTRASAVMSKSGIEKAEEGLSLVRQVRQVLEEIRGEAVNSAKLSALIEMAMAEQSAGATQIAGTVNNIAEQVALVSTSASELDGGSRNILVTMGQMVEDTKRITAQTGAQKMEARRIHDASVLIDKNAIDIAGKVENAKRSNQGVTQTLENLRTSTQTLADSIDGLTGRLKALDRETENVTAEVARFTV